MLDVPGAEQHSVCEGCGAKVRMRELRAWVLLADPLSGCLEFGGSLPEEGDSIHLAGRRVDGTYLRGGRNPIREAGSPQQARHDGEPQEHPAQEPNPNPHSRTTFELAQKDIVGPDQVIRHLSGRPFSFGPGEMPSIGLDGLDSVGERG